ncbi:hypothetical protein RRG08_004473 [Elysia crispata]|uniref:Uncharacterized protein n=1 Tax=Elysia crispata TaxID=231223 RepID=A0AAE1EDQ6_9GAST|nr:hypothetical protein RRG08_004473 [Elysia crispata]
MEGEKGIVQLKERLKNAKGKTVAARSLGVGCNADTCKRRCKDKITGEQRNDILKSFCDLGQPQMRWNFIARFFKEAEPKYRRTVKPKGTSRYYTLIINGEEKIVCKKFYLRTLSIAETVVNRELREKTKLGFFEANENRRHSNPPGDLNEDREEIKNQIESFAVVDSHYCRKSSTRKYLSSTLSIDQIHRIYVIKRKEAD